MAASDSRLIQKLEELDQRYAAVNDLMGQSEVATDAVRIVALAKERSQLSGIVEPYRAYKKLAEELAQTQAMLEDPHADPELRGMANDEIVRLKRAVEASLDEIKGILVMSEDSDIDSVLLELRAGTGGEEAALFVHDLLDMYRHYADRRGWKFEILSASPTDMGGFREIIINVKGPGCWSRLQYEGGGHRVQRVPETEAQGRIHTSAATAAVLPEPENIEVQINWEKDVLEHTSRAGGPGGQSVNKVESAIKLEHIPTGITVSMRDEKSQHKNRAKARRILATRVYEHLRGKQIAIEAAARKAMIGSGDRSQRIRTYNFPQNRCTDHRLKGEGAEGANYNLDKILGGDMDELIESLVSYDKAQRLANL